MLTEMLSRNDDFLQPELTTRISSFFANNLLSLDGAEWRRHRRQVAPALNESIMGAVWDESYNQSHQTIRAIFKGVEGASIEVLEGLRTIAMGVISNAGLVQQVPWSQSAKTVEKPRAGHDMPFFQARVTIMSQHFVALLIPTRWLRKSWMPAILQNIDIAVEEYPKYASEIMQEERNALDDATRSNLARNPVKRQDSNLKDALTQGETVGNLFVFAIAGFDTTANTMAYAMMHLAMEHDLQAWVVEEIEEINQRFPEGHYEHIFPLVKRFLAFMYETLRVYSPVVHTSRRIIKPVTLHATLRVPELHVMPDTRVFVSQFWIHMNKEYWPNPLKFRPSRWLAANGELIQPPRGHFTPWSIGPSTCPGMKMAQVEFVSVIRAMLSGWTVDAIDENGEAGTGARTRLLALIDDSRPKVTLQVRDLSKVHLRFRRRNMQSPSTD